MDGSDMQTYALDTSHHDFTVTPNGVAYLSKQGSSGTNNQDCDAIWQMSNDGTGNVVVYDLWNALADFESDSELGELCHANSIDYLEASDSFTVSDLYRDTIVKVSAAGALQWVFGGTASDFSGTDWNKQHGHHLFADNQILIFVNEDSAPSHAIGYMLDTGAMTATPNFNYDPSANSRQMGDIQRLPDGNTLVTASVSGEMHLVDPAQQLIRSFSAQGFGYAEFRTSLYGPPTRR